MLTLCINSSKKTTKYTCLSICKGGKLGVQSSKKTIKRFLKLASGWSKGFINQWEYVSQQEKKNTGKKKRTHRCWRHARLYTVLNPPCDFSYLVIVAQYPAETLHVRLDHLPPEILICRVHVKLVLVVPLLPAFLPQPAGHKGVVTLTQKIELTS